MLLCQMWWLLNLCCAVTRSEASGLGYWTIAARHVAVALRATNLGCQDNNRCVYSAALTYLPVIHDSLSDFDYCLALPCLDPTVCCPAQSDDSSSAMAPSAMCVCVMTANSSGVARSNKGALASAPYVLSVLHGVKAIVNAPDECLSPLVESYLYETEAPVWLKLARDRLIAAKASSSAHEINEATHASLEQLLSNSADLGPVVEPMMMSHALRVCLQDCPLKALDDSLHQLVLVCHSHFGETLGPLVHWITCSGGSIFQLQSVQQFLTSQASLQDGENPIGKLLFALPLSTILTHITSLHQLDSPLIRQIIWAAATSASQLPQLPARLLLASIERFTAEGVGGALELESLVFLFEVNLTH